MKNVKAKKQHKTKNFVKVALFVWGNLKVHF